MPPTPLLPCSAAGTPQREICPEVFKIWERHMPAHMHSMLVSGRSCIIEKTCVLPSYPGLLVYVAAVTQVRLNFELELEVAFRTHCMANRAAALVRCTLACVADS